MDNQFFEPETVDFSRCSQPVPEFEVTIVLSNHWEVHEMRKLVSSASPLEPSIGFSRAVRVGSWVAVAGTAPIAVGGGVACPGDVYGQTKRCLEITKQAIADAGLSLDSVVRTRVMLTDISRWQEAARAHGESFAAIKPACTFVEVKGFIDPEWLVEIETDCIAEKDV